MLERISLKKLYLKVVREQIRARVREFNETIKLVNEVTFSDASPKAFIFKPT